MRKNKTGKALLLGALAALGYSFIKGEGIFNGIRFASIHEAVDNYIENYHPGAKKSDITASSDGWKCIITAPGRRFILNIHKTDDGRFVFSETDL